MCMSVGAGRLALARAARVDVAPAVAPASAGAGSLAITLGTMYLTAGARPSAGTHATIHSKPGHGPYASRGTQAAANRPPHTRTGPSGRALGLHNKADQLPYGTTPLQTVCRLLGVWASAAPYGTSPTCLNPVPSHTHTGTTPARNQTQAHTHQHAANPGQHTSRVRSSSASAHAATSSSCGTRPHGHKRGPPSATQSRSRALTSPWRELKAQDTPSATTACILRTVLVTRLHSACCRTASEVRLGLGASSRSASKAVTCRRGQDGPVAVLATTPIGA